MSNVNDAAPMTPHAFIKKWKKVDLTERQSAHEHFLDLCRLLEHPTPIQDDPIGDHFAFEKGATKVGGGRGFADVWKKDHFAWEYKRKNGDLDAALLQLMRYAPALESPPLQVVCDTDHIRIHTAWTNTVPERYEIALDDLADPSRREILRNVFHNPEKLRPTKTRAGVTKEAADKFSTIAEKLKGLASPEDIAHFVNQLVFCFFADSVKLLPDGLFKKLIKRSAENRERTQKYLNQLFSAMENGGDFDLNDIAWFNGGLFDGREALPLDDADVGLLIAAGSLDWSQIDPSIFGTLFERFLDPDKRAQIGAHYTDSEKIAKIIDPVILSPLRKEWAEINAEIVGLLNGTIKPPMKAQPRRAMRRDEAAEEARSRFLERLRGLKILDPACGSGNFLYLALQGVKDIENKANLECEMLGLTPRLPVIGPEIVHGIEINPLAAELARTTIWIGDIQWRLRNGIYAKPRPILRKLDAIECRDALITKKSDGGDEEALWPSADFIVGNPPFLGGKWMLESLGEHYTLRLRRVFAERIPSPADLVTYWFDKACIATSQTGTLASGLVATNMIRGLANRPIMDRISDECQIFDAWSDEPWVVDGADVRVSIVCFRKPQDGPIRLDGEVVKEIFPDLTGGLSNLTTAQALHENINVAIRGVERGGPFDIPGEMARRWLTSPKNPNGRPNSDVIRPFATAKGVTARNPDKWIIDFSEMSEAEAALYEPVFEHAMKEIRGSRDGNREQRTSRNWWRFRRSGELVRSAIQNLDRYIVTGLVWKHRTFVWLAQGIVPDTRLVVIARSDDTTFGVLCSRFHEAWTLHICQYHGVGNDPIYTQGTTFETFPFPEGLTPDIPAKEYAGDPHAIAIALAAKRLDALRSTWLNPPDLINILPEVVPGYPDRIVPKSANAAMELKKRTLTDLYNQRPQWLQNAQRDLDAAVAAAYGWPADISEDDALSRLLSLNLDRGHVAALDLGDNDTEQPSPSIVPR